MQTHVQKYNGSTQEPRFGFIPMFATICICLIFPRFSALALLLMVFRLIQIQPLSPGTTQGFTEVLR
jgi:hypothetical protein